MQLYELCTITKLGTNKVRITPKGKQTKYYKFNQFIENGDSIELVLQYKRMYFELDREEGCYCLLESENLSRKKSPDIKDLEQTSMLKLAQNIMQNRKQYVIKYFDTHIDELNQVKRFCEIEGVRSFNNIRYEIRRITGFDGVYLIDEEDLADILRQYGFVVGW